MNDNILRYVKGNNKGKKTTGEISGLLPNYDLNIVDSHGYSYLHYAIKSENPEAVSLLLNPELNCDTNLKTNDDTNRIYLTPALYALTFVNDQTISNRIIKQLIKTGIDLTAKDEDDCTLFLRLCEKGRVDVLEYLLSLEGSKADINEKCKYGGGLHMAVIGQQDDVVSYLLDRKIDTSITDQRGNTALHLAIEENQMNVFKLIADYVVNNKEIPDEFKKELFNKQNNEGNTILHELAYAQSSILQEYVKKFPKNFAVDQEIKNKEGYTYIGVSENLIKIQEEKAKREKQMREEIKKEKERLREERIKEEMELKKEKEKQRLLEEERQRFGEKLIKMRGYIFGGIFLFLMLVLYFAVKKAATKKKETIIL